MKYAIYCKKHEGERFLYYFKECDTSLCDKFWNLEKFHKLNDIVTFIQLMNEANQNLGFIKKILV